MKISVLLPTYNEAQNIAPLVHEILASLAAWDTEVIVIDDDSPDGTWRIAGEIDPGSERVRVLRRRAGRGLVASLEEGIAQARGAILCWMDADFSMPPSLLPELVRLHLRPKRHREGVNEICSGPNFPGSKGRSLLRDRRSRMLPSGTLGTSPTLSQPRD